MTVQYATKVIHDSPILIVDDLDTNREVIVGYLEQDGFQYIETARDGIEALEKTKTFDPDLIVLDLLMPRMSGSEVLRHLRADPKYVHTPILVQTIIENPQERHEAWQSGATDILTKPINRTELISRIKVQLNNIHQIRELEHYKQMAADDVAQGLELQRLLLPTTQMIQDLQKKHCAKIESMFVPSRFLSGDLWGIIELSDEKFALWIADFSGKGTRAALNTFRLHTLIQEYKYCADDPSELIDVLNNRLVQLMPVGHFSTFLMGVIDFKEGVFRYAAASATHPLIYYPGQEEYQIGDATGVPLGLLKNAEYPMRQLPFPVGASLLLYSDLLWEEEAIPDVTLVEENVAQMVKGLNGQTFSSVLKEQFNSLGDLSLPDDLTFVEVQRLK